MAAGDTIRGQVRVVKENQMGDRLVVAGPYSSTECDQSTFNNRLFINVSSGRGAPFGAANIRRAPEAKWKPGEKISLQHKSSSLAEAIDFDADEIEIAIVERDLNTGIVQERTLTAADTELTANPTSSTTVWTEFFRDTCPDRIEWGLKGQFQAAAVENA